MSLHQERINEFMRKAGQEVPNEPCVPDEDVRRLRATLILEEALETIHALGFSVEVDLDGENAVFVADREPDLIQIADGCADVSVVTIGTLSACGIRDDALLRVVDESNLAKFGPGGRKREDGKWIKPADWKSPDIEGAIFEKEVAGVATPA